MKKKIGCIFFNVIFLVLSMRQYLELQKREKIIDIDKPLIVNIKKINYSAKSSTTCDLIYNNKEYRNIEVLENTIKIGNNSTDFYIDIENDEIFHKEIGKSALLVTIGMFIVSLFFWTIPQNKW